MINFRCTQFISNVKLPFPCFSLTTNLVMSNEISACILFILLFFFVYNKKSYVCNLEIQSNRNHTSYKTPRCIPPCICNLQFFHRCIGLRLCHGYYIHTLKKKLRFCFIPWENFVVSENST